MAHLTKETKTKIHEKLKAILPKREGWAWTLSGANSHAATLTINAGPVDLCWRLFVGALEAHERDPFSRGPKEWNGNGQEINWRFVNEDIGSPFDDTKALFAEIVDALNTDNYDNSDPMSDYFSVGHYVHIRLGTSSVPYKYNGKLKAMPKNLQEMERWEIEQSTQAATAESKPRKAL
jgi:hypothetical protein